MKYERLFIRSTLNYDGFPDYAESLGLNVRRLRTEFGLGEEKFNKQVNIVSWNAVCAFYERAAEEIGNESLGMQYALNAKADFSGVGPIIYVGATSKDAGHFLRTIAKYQSIRTNGIFYELEENFEAGEVLGRYRVNPHSAPCKQLLENTMALAALTAKKLIPGFKVKYVSFTHEQPSNVSIHKQVFDAPVYFGAKENLLVSDMSYYDVSGNQLSVGFRDFALKAYFNGRIEFLPDAKRSICRFIRAVLPSILGMGLSDLDTFAKSLNLHPKKLQRLLKDEGESFSDILNDVRMDLAHSLLVNTDSSILHIASLLDYSTDRPFTTACKRWFELSPTQYRKKHLEKQSHELSFLM